MAVELAKKVVDLMGHPVVLLSLMTVYLFQSTDGRDESSTIRPIKITQGNGDDIVQGMPVYLRS